MVPSLETSFCGSMERNFYQNYLANLNKPSPQADWSRPYGWYLRGWLPADREARILELGCGEGNLLATLKGWGYREVRGIDLRPEAIAFCRHRGLKADLADARTYLRGKTGGFQLIVAVDLLEHLSREDGLRLLEDVHRALHPNGAVILQVPNLGSPFGGTVFYGDLTHLTGFTETSIRQLLKLAGFSRVEVREAGPGFWSVKSAIRYLGWGMLKIPLRLWHLLEGGNPGPSVLTRVMLARAQTSPGKEP